MPSIEREGMNMATIEAMAAGLPVISTWVGGMPELVENGISGFLVEPQNPPALAKALRTLMESKDLRKKWEIRAEFVSQQIYLKKHDE